jgi:uncharacterized protein DUF4340
LRYGNAVGALFEETAMNNRTLSLLIGAAVLALGAAVVINISKRPMSEASEQAKPLLPSLSGHVNDVSSIVLTGADTKVLATLKRGNNGWSIVQKSDYPADLAKIREFLLKLDQATLIEQKTANPKLYAELGVDDVKAKDAKGILVDINGLAQPVKLIIGNFNGGGGGGTFVRIDGDAQTWLAKGNLTVAKNVADWESRDLTDIAANRLQAVTLTSPDGKVLKITKEHPADSNFKVQDVPKGRETSSEFAANGLGSTLAALRADDAFPAKDMPPPEKVYKAEYVGFDGVIVDLTGWNKDGKDYAQFTAKLDGAIANAQIDSDVAAKAAADAAKADAAKPDAAADPVKDRKDKLDALSKEVDALNKAFSGWTFALPSFKFSNVTKTMDDMLKQPETKKPDIKNADGKPAAAPVKAPAKPAGQ